MKRNYCLENNDKTRRNNDQGSPKDKEGLNQNHLTYTRLYKSKGDPKVHKITYQQVSLETMGERKNTIVNRRKNKDLNKQEREKRNKIDHQIIKTN